MERSAKVLLCAILAGIVLILVSVGLAAATLAIVSSRLKETTTTITPTPSSTITTTITPPPPPTITTTTTNSPSFNSTYVESIHISDVMKHLNELQTIATNANGNRAINTRGFNETLDYIYNSLTLNTNFRLQKSFFYLRNFVPAGNPILLTSIGGVERNRTYSTTLSASEFAIVQYTRSANFASYIPITVIPNLGCSDSDWTSATSPIDGRVALVKRGNCSFIEKALLATKYNATALLTYNDGTVAGNVAPIVTNLGQDNEIPALFLSYTLGQELVDAAQDPLKNVGVRLIITMADESRYPVGNICADTPTGDATQTIVIGSHSDSVPAGPGINDNGSGSAANLGLAIALARLFQTSTYPQYKYRVRFCWWGAEEVGLLGSDFHVKQADNATTVGERLQDYLINLNYDMLGSPNYIFGIYDGRTANANTPPQALPGSNKITALFRSWFEQQKLPWDYTDFSGRSDYGPFLAKGIVAGGLFSGADERKSFEQRDRYDQMLGQGMGGVAGAIQDPCYHQACDSIQNINVFAYEKMVQAAAYTLEYLAQQDNLKEFLYPSAEIQRLNTQAKPQRVYNSINEYFGLPYL
ncbi:unnamed protein product [Adineta steineri]|uniref:Aminopeptidase n=1 Tax=Adineta steineri TaxID=433720 RepID=A0A819QC61_9BILA|nr:unnamed protein product [Adineta steineri]CAF4029237.1 unnamed protein product [Adineta steineri]